MANWFTKMFSTRSIENPQFPLTATNVSEYIKKRNGVVATPQSIMSIPALYGGLRLMCFKFASLGVMVYKNSKNGGYLPDKDHPSYKILTRSPDGVSTCSQFFSSLLLSTYVYGNGLALVHRDELMQPEWLELLDPEKVEIESTGRNIQYTIDRGNNQKEVRYSDEILHLKGLNGDSIQGTPLHIVLGQSLGLTIEMQAYLASYFRNGCRVGTVFKMKKPVKDKNTIDKMEAEYNRKLAGSNEAFKSLVLAEDMDIEEIGKNNGGSDLSKLTEDQLRACAAIIGVPPSYLGITDGYTSNNSLESQQKQLLADCLNPWLVQFEECAEKVLLTEKQLDKESHFIEFDRNQLDATDSITKNEIRISKLTNNLISWEEARGELNLPATREGTYFRQANISVVDSETFEVATPEPVAQVSAQPQPELPNDAETPTAEPMPDSETPTREKALTEKTVERLIKRLQKSVESNDSVDLSTSHRAVFVESLDCFPTHQQATDKLFDELQEELRAICKQDRNKIDWNRYRNQLIEELR